MNRRTFIEKTAKAGSLTLLPSSLYTSPTRGDNKGIIRNFIRLSFPDRFHEPTGLMRYPFIDPGAAYKGILWDWDAYFSLRGLLPWKAEAGAIAEGCIRNFLDFQREDGSVPYAITKYSKKNKSPRPADSDKNSAKPLLAQFAFMACEYTGKSSILETCYEGLKRHCLHWEESQGTSLGLLTFRSHRGSGVDDHPGVFCRPLNSSVDVYLNSMMYKEYRTMASIAKQVKSTEVSLWEDKANKLQENIEKHLWDPVDECYYNLDVGYHRPGKVNQEVTWVTPLKFRSWTALMPIWAGAASPERAEILVNNLLMKEEHLLSPSGMRSLSKSEPAYEIKVSSNPSCWRDPVWIVNNFMVCEGLRAYGFEQEVTLISTRIQELLAKDIGQNNLLHEYYDPETGKGLTHPGFLNWNTLGGII
ncbi:MAG: hypothetical protein KI786_09395 [Mameliella sp.]|nr:hypothetical protein [Phaeodactylibacter sp.]